MSQVREGKRNQSSLLDFLDQEKMIRSRCTFTKNQRRESSYLYKKRSSKNHSFNLVSDIQNRKLTHLVNSYEIKIIPIAHYQLQLNKRIRTKEEIYKRKNYKSNLYEDYSASSSSSSCRIFWVSCHTLKKYSSRLSRRPLA